MKSKGDLVYIPSNTVYFEEGQKGTGLITQRTNKKTIGYIYSSQKGEAKVFNFGRMEFMRFSPNSIYKMEEEQCKN